MNSVPKLMPPTITQPICERLSAAVVSGAGRRMRDGLPKPVDLALHRW